MTLPQPPDPFVGRTQQVREARTAILQRIPAVIYGMVGVGKGSVCLAAGHSAGPAERHGGNAWLVDCEGCDRTEHLIARTIDAVFPVDQRPSTAAGRGAEYAVQAKLEACTENQQPALLIFDNLETLLRAPDCEAMLALIKDWAAAGMTVVLLAVHSATAPRILRELSIGDGPPLPIAVPRLSAEDATALFLEIAPQYADDPELPAIINELDGVALAVALVARGACRATDKNLSEIHEDLSSRLNEAREANEGQSRQSIGASVRLALDTLPPYGSAERRVVALLGLLPGGIAESDLRELVPSGEAAASAVAEMGLAFLDDSESVAEARWRTLKPVRECLARLCPLSPEERTSIRDRYLRYVDEAGARPDDPQAQRRVVDETRNIDAMVELLGDDPRRQCDVLLSTGESQWLARRSELSRSTFDRAAAIARSEGDVVRLTKAALGFSGGMTGSGHSFDHGDTRRLEMLREALDALGDQDPDLRLMLLTRLLHELHFDATAAGESERAQRQAEARETVERVRDERASLGLLLQQLAEAGPKTVGPAQRLKDAADLIDRAERLGDSGTELSARMLRVFALLEDGQSRAGTDEIACCRSLAQTTDDGRSLWKVEVMERAMLLFAGRFDEAREQLAKEPSAAERDQGIVAERRTLHQRVVLAMDAGDLGDVVEPVEALVRRLREDECDKLGLKQGELRALRYQWWPTWRASQALVLTATARGDEAGDVLYELGRNGFGDIMPAEYWLQALAVIGIAAAWNYDHDPDPEAVRSLYDLLLPYANRSIVPGSVALNLGSVSTVIGMLAARLRMWSEAVEHLRIGVEHNGEMGSPPAVARTQLELALLHQRRVQYGEGEQSSRQDAADAARACLEIARELGMLPVSRRATQVRSWAAVT